MKAPDARRVIVSQGVMAGTVEVHHQDFPEIRAPGENPVNAASHLANQLARAMDSALTQWRRESIQNAIDDVEAYRKAGSA